MQMFGKSTDQNHYPVSGSDASLEALKLVDSDVTEGSKRLEVMSEIQASKP